MAIDPWCGRGLLGSLAAALGRLACVPGVSRACPGRIGIFSLFFKSKNGILLGYPYLSRIWHIGVSATSYTAIQRILTYRCFVGCVFWAGMAREVVYVSDAKRERGVREIFFFGPG